MRWSVIVLVICLGLVFMLVVVRCIWFWKVFMSRNMILIVLVCVLVCCCLRVGGCW